MDFVETLFRYYPISKRIADAEEKLLALRRQAAEAWTNGAEVDETRPLSLPLRTLTPEALAILDKWAAEELGRKP